MIALVAPSFSADARVTIIEADVFACRPLAGAMFDVVWHDIWPAVSPGNLDQMRRLEKKYKKICKWQGCWHKGMCKAMARSRARKELIFGETFLCGARL